MSDNTEGGVIVVPEGQGVAVGDALIANAERQAEAEKIARRAAQHIWDTTPATGPQKSALYFAALTAARAAALAGMEAGR